MITSHHRKGFLTLAVLALIAGMVVSDAATPNGGSLTEVSPSLTYASGPFLVPNPSSQATGTPTCSAQLPCDDYALSVSVLPATTTNKLIKVKVAWPTIQAQIDVYILDAVSNNIIAAYLSSNTNVDPDLLLFPAVTGNYTVRIVPFNPAG